MCNISGSNVRGGDTQYSLTIACNMLLTEMSELGGDSRCSLAALCATCAILLACRNVRGGDTRCSLATECNIVSSNIRGGDKRCSVTFVCNIAAILEVEIHGPV